MDLNMQENGIKVNNMELELLLMKMELKDKLDGKMEHYKNGLILNLDIYYLLFINHSLILYLTKSNN